MPDNIKGILSDFTAVTLEEMDNLKLMDRTDTKFIFKKSQLPAVLKELINEYKVLEVNNHRCSKYESLYFDTENFDLYHKHHRGKTNRYKVRYRKYVESDLIFFELKYKNNRDRTVKSRVSQKKIDEVINGSAEALLNQKTMMEPGSLQPKLWINYSRVTLVNKNSPERVTIDIDLLFKRDGHHKHFDDLIIAEVKQDKAVASPFIRLMKKMHIREGALSKYCLGVINLFHPIKHNNFKPNLISLNRLLHDIAASA